MADRLPYRDPDQPLDRRVADLCERMTREEKVGQLVGTYVGHMDVVKTPEDVVAEIRTYDGLGTVVPFGVSAAETTDPADAARLANRLQEVAIEETRLGIPLAIPVDATHGHAYVADTTVLPHGLAMGATRRPVLARDGARVTAREIRATGGAIAYSPTADVCTDQRWGRAFETFGETPHLCGRFARAKVDGLQGGDLAEGVAACVKHFPAYGRPAGGEDAAPVDVSETTLRRHFLPPFEDALGGDPATVMPCYNAVGPEPAHASERLLGDLLREELAFDGAILSDWGGIEMLHADHGVARDRTDAAFQSRRAGVDLASIGGPTHADALLDLLAAGELADATIDRQVERILALKFRLGLFEDPYVDPEAAEGRLATKDHRETALEAARAAMTLLDNDGTLPLDSDADLLVTGPNADSLVHQVGGWSVDSEADLAGTTIREGLAEIGEGTVAFEQGATLTEERDLAAVASAASEADAAIAVVGEGWYIHEFGGQGGEDADAFPHRASLSLPSAQRALLETLAETNTPTVAVLVSGRPLAITADVDALLCAYYPGSMGGPAVAETLSGEHNPAGILPISIPKSASHVPCRIEDWPHPRPIGDDPHLDSYDPLYPFGHGLSYTDFALGPIECSRSSLRPGETVEVTVPVENIGERAGERAVDVFVRDRVSSVVTPRRRHVGFDRVAVDPGETATVSVTIDAADLAVQVGETRRVEPGEYDVLVGDEQATIELGSDYW